MADMSLFGNGKMELEESYAAIVHKRLMSFYEAPDLAKRCKTQSNSNSPRASVSPLSTSTSPSQSYSNTSNSTVQNSPQSQQPPNTSLLSYLLNSASVNSPPSKKKSLECIDTSVTYCDLDSNANYRLTEQKFTNSMAYNMRSYIQSNIPPDTLLKFGPPESALASHKLILYNASPFFRRRYDESTSQNGIFILIMEPHLCVNAVRTCLDYIYSMGLGDIDLGPRNSLSNLKHTAQFLELADLTRLVDLVLKREPPETPINHSQPLGQMYTNLMIEQILKKLCGDDSKNLHTQLEEANLRFRSLFNKSKVDLSRFERDFELDTISRDLVIKDKYVYPSQDITPNFLDAVFENSVLVNLDSNLSEKPTSNEFQRYTLIIFSINLDSSKNSSRASSSSPNENLYTQSPSASNQNHHSTSSSVESRAFKLQNFVIKSRLNFTELSILKEEISRLMEQFLNQVLAKCIGSEQVYRCVVNRVCYLKKPSNCKTIRVETIKSSTDCLRAIVEYSRLNEVTRELPYVFLTTHSSVYISSYSS